MLDAVLDGLDVTVKHRAIRPDPQPVSRPVDSDPILGSELLVRYLHSHATSEYLSASARQSVEAGFAQRDQNLLDRHLLDAGDVRNLNRRQRLDVNLGMPALELPEHLAVVVESRMHVEAADDVELFRQAVPCYGRLVEYLLERVPVCAFFLREPRERTKNARLPEIADVGWVDVLIGGKCHDVAVSERIHMRSKRSETEKIRRAKHDSGVMGIESRARQDLFANRAKRHVRNT